MNALWGSLSGKKTYIAAAMTALGAVAGYLTGTLTPGEAFNGLMSALMMAGVRHGVENS